MHVDINGERIRVVNDTIYRRDNRLNNNAVQSFWSALYRQSLFPNFTRSLPLIAGNIDLEITLCIETLH